MPIKQKHNNLQTSAIFSLLDKIEDKTGRMAHEIDKISNQLRLWQKSMVSNSFMKETLNKYWDEIN